LRRPNVRHRLTDVLTIALLAVLCGANDWVEFVECAQAKVGWRKTFLELLNSIPTLSHPNHLWVATDIPLPVPASP